MKVRKEYIGQVFNRLTIVANCPDRVQPSGQKRRYVTCKCSCGGTKDISLSNILGGKVQSCGCVLSELMSDGAWLKKRKVGTKSYDDLTGNTNGKLRVLGKFDWFEGCRRKKTRSWICVCLCGAFTVLPEDKFKRNTSCGCQRRGSTLTHGEYHNHLYRTYHGMIQRCYNINSSKFHLYGGNGVTVCDRWLEVSPHGFLNFLEDMGEKPKGTSLNRVSGAKIYSKENCSWDDLTVQSFDQLLTKQTKSGHIGIIITRHGTYSARISYKNKIIHLGTFKVLEDAVAKRKEAEIEYYGFAKQTI